MRIHAFIAKYTDISRREAEKCVLEGRVKVDGKIAEVGQNIEQQRVVLDGKVITASAVEPTLLVLNKPVGYECSRKPQGKHLSVYDLLPPIKTGKWILVGRLDINTSGLLLVSNDGVLANQLAHPSSDFKRVYLVRINGVLSEAEIRALKKGVMLEDGLAKCKDIKPHRKREGVNHWYQITLTEGRNRLVRRLMEYYGKQVSRLIRVQFGPIKLEKVFGLGRCEEVDIKWMSRYI